MTHYPTRIRLSTNDLATVRKLMSLYERGPYHVDGFLDLGELGRDWFVESTVTDTAPFREHVATFDLVQVVHVLVPK